MTVCIAVECCAGTDDHRLILCADGLMSSGLGKTDMHLKIRPSGDWHLLTAGRDDDMVAIVEDFRDRVREAEIVLKQPINDDTGVLTAMRAALAKRKKDRSDEILQANYALSHAELLEKGKDLLPEIYRDALLLVRDAKVEAEFIVAGFERTGYPLIVEADQSGRVSIREKFAVIGAGGALAQTVLMHRQYTDFQSLTRALYCVFEAKKYAEGEISVGPTTNIIIVDKSGRCTRPSKECYDWLGELYAEYGPKEIPKELKQPENLNLEVELRKAPARTN